MAAAPGRIGHDLARNATTFPMSAGFIAVFIDQSITAL
jgi:hypothetical protein